MNSFEVYKLYTALRLHFTSKKYDFFEYEGAINRSPASFDKLKEHEKRLFLEVSRMREPKTYLVGNFLFNPSNYIRDFSDKYYIDYRKFVVNGEYIFKEELGKLKKPLSTNFSIDGSSEIPYILVLMMEENISLYTACVFERLINWTNKVENEFVDDITSKVKKSHKFFKMNLESLKKIIVTTN